MESVYTKIFHILPIHLDRFGKVKPSALLHFAQEAAGDHCKELALDWDTLAKRNLFWAVLRHRVQITRMPVAGDVLTVETWPMPTTRSSFPRAVAAYDAQGNEVFRCISLWVLMDANTRAMVLPGKSGVDLTGALRGCELAVPGSIVPKNAENALCRQVGYTELDRNGHMNNTRCMDWVDDLLSSEFHRAHTAREFSVCYLSEAREGQKIQLNWQLSDGPFLQVDAHRQQTDVPEKQTRVFSVQVHF